MTRYLATVAMMLTALPIYAQTYKCKDPGGTTVFSKLRVPKSATFVRILNKRNRASNRSARPS